MNILSIDPGNTESAYTLLDLTTRRPTAIGKVPNHDLLHTLVDLAPDHVAVEMIRSYGMPVGAEVFETCVWIGRYTQHIYDHTAGVPVGLIYRGEVKSHLCHSTKASDANVTQALVDRFAPGQPNRGKGTKATPGWFYGFKADIWQAYAVGVLAADRLDPSHAAVGF